MTTFDELITNAYTKRKSSTRAAYLICIVLAVLIVFGVLTVMIIDTVKDGRICVDYFSGLSQILYIAPALILAAGIPKTLSDKFQKK